MRRNKVILSKFCDMNRKIIMETTNGTPKIANENFFKERRKYLFGTNIIPKQ